MFYSRMGVYQLEQLKSNTERTSVKSYIHYIIAAVLFLIFYFCIPAANGLTEKGVTVLAIMVPVLYLWIAVNTDWVSLVAMAALIMSGTMTANEVWAGSMGNFIVITIIVCMALNAVLTQTGVINKVAVWFITRKVVQGRPYMFIALYFFSFFLLGTFMEATSLTVIYIGLTQALCKNLKIEKGEPMYTVLMAGVFWGNAIISAASPISHVLPLLLIAAVEGKTGITISYGQWLSVGIPFEIMMYVFLMLVVRIFWKPDTSKFANYDIEEVKRSAPPLGKEGKLAAVLFILVVIAWLFPQFGSSFAPGLSAFLTRCGTCIPPIVAIAILCIVRLNNKPIVKFPALVKDIPIGLLVFTATVTVMGAVINLPDVGISDWIRNLLLPVTSVLPPFAVMAVLVLGALIMTNFLSNTVTMFLFYSIALSLLSDTGINVIGFVVVISLASCMGMLTPSASVPAPLFFGPGHITVRNTVKYCTIYIILTWLGCMFLIWPLASALIRF